MKKTYAAPKLNNHGTVAKMTEQFGPSGRDTLFGPDGSPVSNGTGSIDACATTNQTNCLPGSRS